MVDILLTPELIALHYIALLDSVDLINGGQQGWMTNNDWTMVQQLNIDHIILMLDQDYWTTEDLSSAQAIIG